jgi:Tfp pilus assembly protein PilF
MTRARSWVPWPPLFVLLVACATTPPADPQAAAPSSLPVGETPEVPEGAPTSPPPAQGGVEVVKTVPAPDSTVTEAPSPAPAAPAAPQPRRVSTDSGTQSAFQRAVELAHQGDTNGAERELKRVVERDPKLDYGWTNLGMVQERLGRNDQAEKSYRRALEIHPGQEAAWDALTRLYSRTGRTAQIEEQLRQAISAHPAELGPRNALVLAMLHQKKFEPAATEAKKILKSDERNVRAMQHLAQIYFREGKNELAKMVLENARAIDPNDASTHHSLGLVLLQLKARAQALESFQKAAELRPDFAEARNNLGALLNETEDYEGAVRELEAAVAAAPEMHSARLNLGNAYRGKQELERAAEQYAQVVRLVPALPDTYFNLGILHLDSEMPKMETTERLKTALRYFDEYKTKGGRDDRLEQYVKDANKGLEKEERKREREKRDALKKADKAASDAKKAAEGGEGNPPSDTGAPTPAPAAPAKPGSGKLGGDDK